MHLTGLKSKLLTTARRLGLLSRLWEVRGYWIRLTRSCNSVFGRRRSQSVQGIAPRLYRISADGLPTWFGYCDRTPFSHDNSKILAMVMTCSRDWSSAAAVLPVRLGFFGWPDIVAGYPLFRQFAETQTWSWQQGCMLQWFPKAPDQWVLYNRLFAGRYGSVVQDVLTGDVVRAYPMPIYAIDPYGRWGVGLNFSRLERLRPGYGYRNLPDETQADPCPDSEGLWRMDLDNGECELLLSLREIAGLRPQPSMASASHYLNHLLYSPDGEYCIFLHLWTSGSQRHNRLMLYDFGRSSTHIVDDMATVSHSCWLTDNRLLCFRTPYSGSAGYYVFAFAPDRSSRCEPMCPGMPLQDGHPSLSPSEDLLVTDAYPDRAGDQTLYLYSMRMKTLQQLGTFFSPFRYRGPQRCDLHPRWDRAGRRICFDSAHMKRRAMYILDLTVHKEKEYNA